MSLLTKRIHNIFVRCIRKFQSHRHLPIPLDSLSLCRIHTYNFIDTLTNYTRWLFLAVLTVCASSSCCLVVFIYIVSCVVFLFFVPLLPWCVRAFSSSLSCRLLVYFIFCLCKPRGNPIRMVILCSK